MENLGLALHSLYPDEWLEQRRRNLGVNWRDSRVAPPGRDDKRCTNRTRGLSLYPDNPTPPLRMKGLRKKRKRRFLS